MLSYEADVGDVVQVKEDRWRRDGQPSRIGWIGKVRAVAPGLESLDVDVRFGNHCLWFSHGELSLVCRA